jgi:transcriptional regulator with XRE-family HTH domain/anti-sigma regulatory factor (Ser/Thr protein kinase)
MPEPDAARGFAGEREGVISLAERLKSRRQERGISQSQAARELDVARTAYRLWEMEAAKPAPDRWRLIASWLGVSVTTMLLAEELVSEEEAAMGELAPADFGRGGRDWDTAGAAQSGDFFVQARSLIEDGARGGDISPEQAAALTSVLQRVEQESAKVESEAWAAAELRRALPATDKAPRAAREAIAFVAADIPEDTLRSALLLTSELVTNSVWHGPSDPRAMVEIFVQVERLRVRVEVADGSPVAARLRTPSDEGGYGLSIVAALASRWGAGLDDGRNVTWFELDLPLPGTSRA